MQPILAFAQRATDQQAERYVKVVEGMPDEALTWQPTESETNSVAQLVQHVFAATPRLLAMATGTMPTPTPEVRQRWRAHMWRNNPTTQQALLDIIATGRAARDEQLAALDGMDMNGEIQAFGSPMPRMFLIAGVVDHAAEHLGHAELTKQLWEQRGT